METYNFDFILLLVLLSIIIIAGGAAWYGVVSWWRYRFSPWWLLALAAIPFALFLFPLYSSLRYNRAKKLKKPQSEIERNLLYRRMSWALVVCGVVVNLAIHVVLRFALPDASYVNELQFSLTTLSLAIASVGCLWAVRQR